MNAGTKMKPRCITIHTLWEGLPKLIIRNLMAYHAITGCDSTSQFCGYSKMTTWRAYKANPNLLNTFTDQSEDAMRGAEKFIIKFYSPTSQLTSINALRAEMFHKVLNPEKLPPSKDALSLHLKRSMYQMSVWEQAKVAKPNIQLTTECGWCYTESGELVPILTTLPPIPKVCKELLSCS